MFSNMTDITKSLETSTYLVGIPLLKEGKYAAHFHYFNQLNAQQKCEQLIQLFNNIVDEITNVDPHYNGIIIALREYAIEGVESTSLTAKEKNEILAQFKQFIDSLKNKNVTIITGGISYYHSLDKTVDKNRFEKKIIATMESYANLTVICPELKQDKRFIQEKNTFDKTTKHNSTIHMLYNVSYTISKNGINKHSKKSPYKETKRSPETLDFPIHLRVYNPGKNYHHNAVNNLNINITSCREALYPQLRKPLSKQNTKSNDVSINFLLSDWIDMRNELLDVDVFTGIFHVDSNLGTTFAINNEHFKNSMQIIPCTCHFLATGAGKLVIFDLSKSVKCEAQGSNPSTLHEYSVYSDTPSQRLTSR